MGTSQAYQAPTTPQWGELKGDVTRISSDGAVTFDVAGSVLGGYIRTNGGAERMAHGGGAIGGSRVAQAVGRRFAGFVGSVAGQGLDGALRDAGLEELIGRPAGEVTLALVDQLCEDGSILDEIDARNALSDLTQELLAGAETYEEVKQRFEERFQLSAIGNLLSRFFGHYIYHQFCRVFYERLVSKHGEEKTSGFLKSIKRFITSTLRLKTFGKNLSRIKWAGQEGKAITDDVLHDTLLVFGG